jgi:hypothetical protein
MEIRRTVVFCAYVTSPAGRSKLLKNEKLHSSSDQRAGKPADRFRLGFVLRTPIQNTLFQSSF